MTQSITAPGGERALGPSYAGRVVLDLGADIGALVLDARAGPGAPGQRWHELRGHLP
jgi:hypothetical protein